jgi:hypothetical protein
MWHGSTPTRLVAACGALVVASGVLLAACEAPPPAVVTPIPSTPRAIATLNDERPLSVAVAVGPPTPTPALVGDYATLVRPRLERVGQGLKRLEQQLAVLQQSPIRMAEQDWRAQTRDILDELALGTADLRALGARVGAQGQLSAEVMKLVSDLDFVVDEYRMALDFDPDATHFARAGRAQKTSTAEVESILSELRRPVGIALSPTPVR